MKKSISICSPNSTRQMRRVRTISHFTCLCQLIVPRRSTIYSANAGDRMATSVQTSLTSPCTSDDILMPRVSMLHLNSSHQCCFCHRHSFCIFFSNYCNDSFVTLSVCCLFSSSTHYLYINVSMCSPPPRPFLHGTEKSEILLCSNKDAFRRSSEITL